MFFAGKFSNIKSRDCDCFRLSTGMGEYIGELKYHDKNLGAHFVFKPEEQLVTMPYQV